MIACFNIPCCFTFPLTTVLFLSCLQLFGTHGIRRRRLSQILGMRITRSCYLWILQLSRIRSLSNHQKSGWAAKNSRPCCRATSVDNSTLAKLLLVANLPLCLFCMEVHKSKYCIFTYVHSLFTNLFGYHCTVRVSCINDGFCFPHFLYKYTNCTLSF